MAERVIQLEEARLAKDRAKTVFRHFGKVNGVGITRQGDSYAVQVNFEEAPEKNTELPTEIDGVPVVVRVIGHIRKLSHP